jgi:hypothetical protein
MLYAIIALLATFVVIATLHIMSKEEPDVPPFMQLEGILQCLSWYNVPLLAITFILQTMVYGTVVIEILPIVCKAVTKATFWIGLCGMVSFHVESSILVTKANCQIPSTSWTIVPAIGTFSVLSNVTATTPSSRFHTLMRVVASLFALGYIIRSLPQSATFKSMLWGIWLIPLISFVAQEATIAQASMSYSSYSASGINHPSEDLIRNAISRFVRMLETQSSTYEEAHEEYIRRYGIIPPPGFEDWYNFATFHQSFIIDDFDVIHEVLKPFFHLSGQDVARLMKGARDAPENDLWHCTLGSEMSKSHCLHPYRSHDRNISDTFDSLLSDERAYIPHVELLVNHLDEPAVLIPPDFNATDSLKWTDLSHQPTWHKITQFCDDQNTSPQSSDSERETGQMSFIHDTSLAYDLCQHPEYEREHGLLMSPTSFRLIEAAVPILSTGSFSTMGDVLFPSPAYTQPEFQYQEQYDIEWEAKRNNLYWSGSTTGGYASLDNWRLSHRQRLTALGQNLDHISHQYLRVKSGIIESVKSSFLNTRLYGLALTRIFQCSKETCSEQNAYFQKSGWADQNRALKSRLVFDLDGNGISGRFYKFLASKSCPLKQTLFREWHDDRLIPWVHYVPVSLGLKELPELVSYLTLSEIGQQRAEEIAEQGREWHSRALRDIDMSIYLYRLILEIARLEDPAREASK